VQVQRLVYPACPASRRQQQALGVGHPPAKISLLLLLLLVQMYARMQQQMGRQTAGESGSESWTLMRQQQQQAQVTMQQLMVLVELPRQRLLWLAVQMMALAVHLLLQSSVTAVWSLQGRQQQQ
jgi:steroid 5-alpha reductase family enzyme